MNNFMVNVDAADLPRKCVRCRVTYYELDNIGGWRCWQHTRGIKDGRFLCCNMPTNKYTAQEYYDGCKDVRQRGCVQCDHTTQSEPYTELNGIVRVPVRIMQILSCISESYHIENNNTNGIISQNGVIYRYDHAAYLSILSQMSEISAQNALRLVPIICTKIIKPIKK